MTFDDFVQEAELLARSATVLRLAENGEEAEAYWYRRNPGKPCLSLRSESGWLSVYLDDEGAGNVEEDQEPPSDGCPLVGEKVRSLPPVDGVFQLGSAAIDPFLKANRWSREYDFNDNFPSPIASKYESVWQAQNPVYQPDGIVAVLGGWHFPWPDGDWREFINHELVAWVISGAEPWVEVFRREGKYEVVQRIA